MRKENRNTIAMAATATKTINYPAGEKTPFTLYTETIKNKFIINNQTYCVIPISLIKVDESYQRNKSCDQSNINALANNIDMNLLDPVLLSEHPEEGKFAVIDGYHRIEALNILGHKSVLARIASGLSSNPKERSVQEAEIFKNQDVRTERLTVGQKHKACVKCGIHRYVVLEECIQGRKLFVDAKYFRNMPEDEKARYADWKVLSGYTSALAIAGYTNGKELLNSVLNIIEASHWRDSANGYSSKIIRTIATILNLHDNSEFVCKAMVDYFLPMEPNEFIARAYEKYPARREKERLDILLESEVSKRMGFAPMYTGGDLRGGLATQRAIAAKKAEKGTLNNPA